MRQPLVAVGSMLATRWRFTCSIVGTGVVIGLVWCGSGLATTDARSPELAVRVGEDLVLVSVDGGRRHLGTGYPNSVTFSPDGRSVVYSGPTGRGRGSVLFVQSLATDGRRRRLTRPVFHGRLATDDQQPAVSPDGTLVAFIRDRQLGDGKHRVSLLIVPFAGGRPRPLRRFVYRAGYGAPIRSAAWSPDGTSLAVVIDGRVVLLMPTGRTVRVVSPPDTLVDSRVSWSPDGREIAVGVLSRKPTDPGAPGLLLALRVRGGAPRTLLTCLEGCADPAWSPDGKRIAVSDGTGPLAPAGSIFAMRILDAATGTMQWSSNPSKLLDRSSATWSRDGRYLAFERFTSWAETAFRTDTAILDTQTRRITAILPGASPFAWR